MISFTWCETAFTRARLALFRRNALCSQHRKPCDTGRYVGEVFLVLCFIGRVVFAFVSWLVRSQLTYTGTGAGGLKIEA
jgi:hypothetical protein